MKRSPSGVARLLFAALDEARWADAAALASDRFLEEQAPHFAFRLRGLRDRHPTEADLEVPKTARDQFALWIEKSDVRAESARALADAQHEDPETEYVIVGGADIRRRYLVGEILEGPDRAIVVYRLIHPRGSPSILELELEGDEWKICSEGFSFEGGVGLGVRRPTGGDI